MAASLASNKMQSSFLGSSVRCTSSCFTARRPAVALVTVRNAYGDLANVGGGRKWKRIETNDNGKPVKVQMHVKKGDLVQVITGQQKGVVAHIERVIPKKGQVVVKGVNLKTKNKKPTGQDEKGQQTVQEYPIHHSNVMLYSQEKGVRSRVGYKILEDGSKVRYLKKTGEVVPDRAFKQAVPGSEASSSDSSSSSSSTTTDASSTPPSSA